MEAIEKKAIAFIICNSRVLDIIEDFLKKIYKGKPGITEVSNLIQAVRCRRLDDNEDDKKFYEESIAKNIIRIEAIQKTLEMLKSEKGGK